MFPKNGCRHVSIAMKNFSMISLMAIGYKSNNWLKHYLRFQKKRIKISSYLTLKKISNKSIWNFQFFLAKIGVKSLITLKNQQKRLIQKLSRLMLTAILNRLFGKYRLQRKIHFKKCQLIMKPKFKVKGAMPERSLKNFLQSQNTEISLF